MLNAISSVGGQCLLHIAGRQIYSVKVGIQIPKAMCQLQERHQVLLPWLAKYKPVRGKRRAQSPCCSALTAKRECRNVTPNLVFSIAIEYPERNQIILPSRAT